MPTSGIEGRRKAAIRDGKAGYTRRRQEIVQTAAGVFRQLGYDATTLNDVAERLNTDRASLYYYIGSKEELLHEIVRIVLESNVAAAERVRRRRSSATEKLQALIDEMITSFDRNYPQMFVYTEDMGRIARQDSDWAREVVAKTKQFETIVISILAKGKADGEFRADLDEELAALALFGMVNWTHMWYRPGSTFSPDQIAETFRSLFLDGYLARD